jgi:hypothetical protein
MMHEHDCNSMGIIGPIHASHYCVMVFPPNSSLGGRFLWKWTQFPIVIKPSSMLDGKWKASFKTKVDILVCGMTKVESMVNSIVEIKAMTQQRQHSKHQKLPPQRVGVQHTYIFNPSMQTLIHQSFQGDGHYLVAIFGWALFHPPWIKGSN